MSSYFSIRTLTFHNSLSAPSQIVLNMGTGPSALERDTSYLMCACYLDQEKIGEMSESRCKDLGAWEVAQATTSPTLPLELELDFSPLHPNDDSHPVPSSANAWRKELLFSAAMKLRRACFLAVADPVLGKLSPSSTHASPHGLSTRHLPISQPPPNRCHTLSGPAS